MNTNDDLKIAVFFGTDGSSDGKECSSDSDNLGFMHQESDEDEEFIF